MLNLMNMNNFLLCKKVSCNIIKLHRFKMKLWKVETILAIAHEFLNIIKLLNNLNLANKP